MVNITKFGKKLSNSKVGKLLGRKDVQSGLVKFGKKAAGVLRKASPRFAEMERETSSLAKAAVSAGKAVGGGNYGKAGKIVGRAAIKELPRVAGTLGGMVGGKTGKSIGSALGKAAASSMK